MVGFPTPRRRSALSASLVKGGETMAKNTVRTTAKVAKLASKTLAKSSSSKTTKSLAASALSNRRK